MLVHEGFLSCIDRNSTTDLSTPGLSPMSVIRSAACLWMCLIGLGLLNRGTAGEPDLLSLLPSDPVVVIVAKDLGSQIREILGSPLVQNLQKLKSFQNWKTSASYRALMKAREEIETVLDADVAKLGDEILGQSVVLAMVTTPDRGSDDVRGVFLTLARDRKRLETLIERLNAAEIEGQSLLTVEGRKAASGATYWHRRFRTGTKPDEWYVIVNDTVFAWSNSENEIQDVIARSSTTVKDASAVNKPLGSVDEALPGRALIKLFVDPRFVEKLWSLNDPPASSEDGATRILRRALSSIAYAGAALEWKDGLFLHMHQTFHPGAFLWPSAVTTRVPEQGSHLLERVPDDALLLLSASLPVADLVRAAVQFVPEGERDRVNAGLSVLSGLCLGRDVLKEIAPRIGPGGVAYLVPSGSPDTLFELAVGMELDPRSDVHEALLNGLRTVLSLAVLEESPFPRRLLAEEKAGTTTLMLDQKPRPWTFAVRRGLVAIGTGAEEVGTFVSGNPADPHSPLKSIRGEWLSQSSNFAVLDCEQLEKLARARRDKLVLRWSREKGATAESVGADVDKALEFLSLFRAGFLSLTSSEPGLSAHQTMGWIPWKLRR